MESGSPPSDYSGEGSCGWNRKADSRFMHSEFTEVALEVDEKKQNRVCGRGLEKRSFHLTETKNECILVLVPRGSRNSKPEEM
jgi:hypothetical protein